MAGPTMLIHEPQRLGLFHGMLSWDEGAVGWWLVRGCAWNQGVLRRIEEGIVVGLRECVRGGCAGVWW